MADRASTTRRTAQAHPERQHLLRIRVVLWACLLGFLAVNGRLIWLHYDPDPRLLVQEEYHVGSVDLTVPRGNILDSQGRVLATDRQALSLWADPRRADDPAALARTLSSTLDVSYNTLMSRLAQTSATGRPMEFVWVKRWLSEREVELLGDLDQLAPAGALAYRKESLRFYPEGELAAHILGFANRQGVGSEGTELAYDRFLRGVSGRRVARKDSRTQLLPSLTIEYEAPSGGNHVQLTIDKNIQYKLEQELDAALVRTKAPRGMGIVMDVHTGAILAMACRPAYDPNEYNAYGAHQHRNRAIVDVFEPGSAFKIVAAAAALEEGIVAPDTVIDCENGRYRPIENRRRVINDVHPMGEEPFSTCFSESSNIAMVKIAASLGPERLDRWIRRFGFGQQTSDDFRGESAGIYRPVDRWSLYSPTSLPIGQEIAVTMPQLVRAFAVIANGGYVVEPHLVNRVLSREGKVVYQRKQSERRRILSQHTADIMQQLCHLVVTDGTGTQASIPEYRVGGKTGTAQIAAPTGGYLEDKYTAVFAGFAPVRDPQIASVIVIQEPGIRQYYGGHCSGPVFKDVVRDALIQMNCPEDPVQREVERNGIEEHDADTVVARMVLDFFEPQEEELAIDIAGWEAAGGGPVVPDFTGLTKAQARRKTIDLGLRWAPEGVGRVVAQKPAAGTPLRGGELCRLYFDSAA